MFDIEKEDLLKHSSNFYFFNVVTTEYDTESKCPTWLKFLDEIMLGREELIKLIQDIFGYCLVPGNWLETAVLLKGEGENGKSVLLEVLRSLLGYENTSSLSLDDIKHDFRRVELVNRYANICDESPKGKAVESDAFKNLVSGGMVVAEEKFKPPFQFRNQTKLIFAANSFPVIKDHTHAFYRRIVVIPFDFTVPEDKKDVFLPKKLKNEMSGILNWAIEGYRRVIETGRLTKSIDSIEAKNQFAREGDTVRLFIDECCERGESFQCYTEILYRHYSDYCIENKYYACASNEFGRRLKTHYPDITRCQESTGSRKRYYKGVKLFQ